AVDKYTIGFAWPSGELSDLLGCEAGNSRKGLTAGEKLRVKFLPRLSLTLMPNVVAGRAVVRVPLRFQTPLTKFRPSPGGHVPLASVSVYGAVPPIPKMGNDTMSPTP